MGRASNRKKHKRADPDALPAILFRCQKCGKPWLKEQRSIIDGEAACWPCAEERLMHMADAEHQAKRDAWKVQQEMARIDRAAKMN